MMRVRFASFIFVALLAGCALGSHGSIPDASRSAAAARRPATTGSPPIVYVSDYTAGTVDLFEGEPLGSFRSAQITGLSKPAGLAVDGSGRVYVTEAGKSDVLVYAQTTLKQTIPDPQRQPSSVSIGPDGSIYVGNSYDYTLAGHGGSITVYNVLDEFQYTLVDPSFVLGVQSVAVDAQKNLYVTYRVSNAASGEFKLAEFPAGSQIAQQIALSGTPAAVSVDASGDIVVADVTVSNTKIERYAPGATTPLASFTIPRTVYAFALNPANDRIYAADVYGETVRELTYPAGSPTSTFADNDEHRGIAVTPGQGPGAAATPAPHILYVADGPITEYDAGGTGQYGSYDQIGQFGLSAANNLNVAAITPDGRTLYVSQDGSSPPGVQVYDTQAQTQTDFIPTSASGGPLGLAIDAGAQRLYLSENATSGTAGGCDVKVYNPSTHALLGTISGLSAVGGVAVDTSAHRLYVVANGTVRVYDATTLAFITSFGSLTEDLFAGGDGGLALDQAAGKLYVGDADANPSKTDIYRTSDETLLATLPAGARGYALDLAQGKIFIPASSALDVYSTVTLEQLPRVTSGSLLTTAIAAH